MSKLIQAGSTNVVQYFMMRLVADGKAATGLTPTTFDLQYTRELTAAAAKIDGIVGTGGATTHVDSKVFEINSTSSPGLYMVCFPDAAFAAGANQVILNLTYDATVFTEAKEIQLVGFDPFDAVRMGMTGIPAALVGGRMDSSIGAINGVTAAAVNLALTMGTIVVGAATGTPTTTTMADSTLTETTDNHYNGKILLWTSGALKDQARIITGYNGTSKQFTFDATTEACVATDAFVVI